MAAIVRKIVSVLTSTRLYIKSKISYRNNLKLHFHNYIDGKFDLGVNKNSQVTIGESLMIRGPVYMGCVRKRNIPKENKHNPELTIGSSCYFSHNCNITCAEKITIGDNCMFANNCTIIDHDHNFDADGVRGTLKSAPIKIGKKVWCGANVIILKGVTVGDGAIIGAGAVVTKDIPAHTVAVGAPARIVRKIG